MYIQMKNTTKTLHVLIGILYTVYNDYNLVQSILKIEYNAIYTPKKDNHHAWNSHKVPSGTNPGLKVKILWNYWRELRNRSRRV
jgi:hypothetical protein